ncbi:MAG: agmatine deiminase family protein, partial [Candidatus Cloacimonetes bacterium]|nr:agmatine deiminase family protein [Candidatus Cloacimonadota bacterium]
SEKGAPSLPQISRSIIIPDAARMEVYVLESEFVEYEMLVAPSRGVLMRNINPDDIPYTLGDIYQRDAFFPQNPARLGEPYILRDFRGITLTAHPFLYNPVSGVLRVYTRLVLEVHAAGIDDRNVKIRQEQRINHFFTDIYRHHFLNFTSDRYEPVDEQGRIIVICYGAFLEAMQPYMDWKNQKGIPAMMYDVASIGSNATSIKNFIQSEYDNNDGLTFVQLVGDAAQIPTFTSGSGGADPKYALLEGADSYPEIFVGRFSAENVSQVETQVERTVHYERDIVDGDWLHRGFGIASAEGAGIGDDGEADWQHMDNIRLDLLGYTYTVVDQIYATNGGTASDVANAVNEGRTIGNYCGHGSTTSWSTTGFSNSHVNNLTNDFKLPFIYSVACVNGNFTGTTCFAEAWLRATNNTNGNPTGAIAMFASSVNQSWAPPMKAQDEFVDLLTGSGPYAGAGNQFNSIGGLWFNSEGQMLDESNATDMYETWHIFGDASLLVRTDTPQSMTVNHAPSLFVGSPDFTVDTGVAGALICLSDNGYNIISSGYTGGTGEVTLTLDPPPSEPGQLTLTITSFNRITYINNIDVIVNDGPFVVLADYLVDAQGDELIQPGESILLDITLENIGSDPATNVILLVTESDPYITLTDAVENFGNLPPSGSLTRTNACAFEVASYIPHEYPVILSLHISSNEGSWDYSLDLSSYNPPTVHTPTTQIQQTLQPNSGISRLLILENLGGADLEYQIDIETERNLEPAPLHLAELLDSQADGNPAPGTMIPGEVVYTQPSRSYCSASGGCDEYISSVVTGSINNASGCSGYADYTAQSTEMIIGESYSIAVTIGNAYYGDECDIHIDWNQDEDFYDTGETISMSGGPTNFSASITPPETAVPGTTRMRLRLRWYNNANPCGSYTYGEVEDYSLNIPAPGPAWLALNGSNSVNGLIPAQGDAEDISVDFNSTALEEGVYTADLIVTTNDPVNPSFSIPVTLTVYSGGEPQPEINVSLSEIWQNLGMESTASRQFQISNSGDPGSELDFEITWDYSPSRMDQEPVASSERGAQIPEEQFKRLYENILTSRDQDWLTIFPQSGNCSFNEEMDITVEFNSTGMTPGTYNATINVISNGGTPVAIPVTLFLSDDPPGSTTRAIAEFEPMEGVLIHYPFGISLDLIAEMSEDVMVTTIVASSGEQSTVTSQYSSSGVNLANCNFLIAPSNTYWTRDYGPWFVKSADNDIDIVDFTYNRPRPHDNNIPSAMASFLGVDCFLMGLEHTGGNYMTDGMGKAVSSALVYCENPRSFESGDFHQLWSHSGAASWSITGESPYEGLFCAKSGNIDHNETSSVSIQLFINSTTYNQNVSFARKVSCEDAAGNNTDYLAFFIDGTEKGRWDGNAGWSLESYGITTGWHTFEWKYTKNGNTSEGDDCAWIDNVIFPTHDNALPSTLVHQRMTEYLGIDDYTVLTDPLGEYIEHVDCWGKYLDVDKIMIGEVPPSDPRYQEFEDIAAFFNQKDCSYGYPYEVYRVYIPNGEPYTNSLILNDKVLVPVTGSAWDDEALSLYQTAMPGYEVLGFTGSWASTDALHCRIKGVADRNMIHITHIPLHGNVPSQRGYDIEAEI